MGLQLQMGMVANWVVQLRVLCVNGSSVRNGSSVGCEFYVTFLRFGFYLYVQMLFYVGLCLVIQF